MSWRLFLKIFVRLQKVCGGGFTKNKYENNARPPLRIHVCVLCIPFYSQIVILYVSHTDAIVYCLPLVVCFPLLCWPLKHDPEVLWRFQWQVWWWLFYLFLHLVSLSVKLIFLAEKYSDSGFRLNISLQFHRKQSSSTARCRFKLHRRVIMFITGHNITETINTWTHLKGDSCFILCIVYVDQTSISQMAGHESKLPGRQASIFFSKPQVYI